MSCLSTPTNSIPLFIPQEEVKVLCVWVYGDLIFHVSCCCGWCGCCFSFVSKALTVSGFHYPGSITIEHWTFSSHSWAFLLSYFLPKSFDLASMVSPDPKHRVKSFLLSFYFAQNYTEESHGILEYYQTLCVFSSSFLIFQSHFRKLLYNVMESYEIYET